VLRATRRLLRSGGRTAFSVIHLAPDLSAEERERAVEIGPAAVSTRSPSYRHLLRSAGFVEVEQTDVTAEYRTVQRRWLDHARSMEEELAAVEAPGAFAERIEEQLATRTALDEDLLRRSLFVARSR
jgi:hypothetical protein